MQASGQPTGIWVPCAISQLHQVILPIFGLAGLLRDAGSALAVGRTPRSSKIPKDVSISIWTAGEIDAPARRPSRGDNLGTTADRDLPSTAKFNV